MAQIHSVSVRSLAEFAMERGDLVPGYQAASRMREGVIGHKALQELMDWGWQTEAPISRDLQIGGQTLRVHGRADAVHLGDDIVRVQEIKTTGRDPNVILKYDHPVHWAQAEIYAALFCMKSGAPRAEVRIVYARLDGSRREYSDEWEADALIDRLMRFAQPYMDWICAVDGWKERARGTLETLPFPYDDYRDGQREMARAVFLAMKRGSSVLIEAPTGIGKTAAALFGALKALGRGYITSVFYLTARTTGRRAAQDALDRMRAGGQVLRGVTITAKEKSCLLDSVDCMGCPYASGYYDRRRGALREALGMQRLDPEAIRELAEAHELCPFELSLDISETADVVICDYNYVFDPRVRLKRYFEGKSSAGLLVDEAHNLPDRAQEMFSAAISGKRLHALWQQVISFEGRESPMAQLMRRLMPALRCEMDAEPEASSDLPQEIVDAVSEFAEAATELQSAEPEVRDFVFEAQWLSTVAKRFDPERYRALLLPREGWMTLRLWCFDPSGHLRHALSRIGGAALFSATLAPMPFYAAQLGADGEADDSLQLDSPFPRENLKVFRLPVSVSMKDRERTRNAVAQVIHAMAQARIGNYIACFPSYAYMAQLYGYYRMMWPDEEVICQDSRMTEAQRTAFIGRFAAKPRHSMVAFVVLGGIFAEGIDLPDDRLCGAAIVSTGIPQISFEREALRELLDDADDGGLDAAYTYPGIRRVLQAAGRVIRTETDRGVVVLIDVRYAQEKYRELMPPHWDVEDVRKMSDFNARLKAFWRSDARPR